MRSDLGRLVRFNAARPRAEIARERGWHGYRTIKSFIYSERCRRRSVLDHFGDREAAGPAGPLLRRCDAEAGFPTPETVAVSSRALERPAAPPPLDLSEADAPLFEQLKAWRLRAAEGKPAYTVAHNTTLVAIAATRPQTAEPRRDPRRRPQLHRQARTRGPERSSETAVRPAPSPSLNLAGASGTYSGSIAGSGC